jgi:hypothetical protein
VKWGNDIPYVVVKWDNLENESTYQLSYLERCAHMFEDNSINRTFEDLNLYKQIKDVLSDI